MQPVLSKRKCVACHEPVEWKGVLLVLGVHEGGSKGSNGKIWRNPGTPVPDTRDEMEPKSAVTSAAAHTS